MQLLASPRSFRPSRHSSARWDPIRRKRWQGCHSKKVIFLQFPTLPPGGARNNKCQQLTNRPAGDSDLLTVYNAYCSWKRARSTPGSNEYGFCRKNFLSSQTLLNIEDVKMQLVVSIADAGIVQLDSTQKASLNRLVLTHCPPPLQDRTSN